MYRLIALLVIILALAGCAEEEPQPLPTLIPTNTPEPTLPATETPTNTPTATATTLPMPETNADNPDQQAYLRLAHALPGAEPVDIYIEGLSLASNLAYSRATAPLDLVAGEYVLRIFAGGTGRSDSPDLILEEPITLQGRDSLIALYTGTAEVPAVSVFRESTEPLEADESRINLIHAIPNGPEATISQNDVDLTIPVTFGQQSNLVIVPSGEAELNIQAGVQTIATYEANLRERTNYTLIVAGQIDAPDSITLLDFSERVPGRTAVRVMNTFDVSTDVYIGDELLAENLGYAQASEQRILPAEAYEVAFYPAGSDRSTTEPLFSQRITPNADESLVLIGMGTAEDPRMARHRQELAPLPENTAQIAFANTVASARNVLIEYSGDVDPLLNGLAYGQVSRPIEIEADTYDFFTSIVEVATQGETIEIAEGLALQPGYSYLYVITGTEADPVILSNEVGIIQSAIVQQGGFDPLDPDAPSLLRIVSAVSGSQTLDYYLNDEQPLATGAGYGQATESIIIEPGIQMLSVRATGGVANIDALTFEFLGGRTYTAYVYGDDIQEASILLVDNPPFYGPEDGIANIRLVNISEASDVRLGLIYRESGGTVLLPTLDPTTSADVGEFRQPVPPDTSRLFGEITPGSVSSVSRILTGQQDLYIIDNEDRLVAQTLLNITIEPGRQYDIIAYQGEASDFVTAFLVSYDLP